MGVAEYKLCDVKAIYSTIRFRKAVLKYFSVFFTIKSKFPGARDNSSSGFPALSCLYIAHASGIFHVRTLLFSAMSLRVFRAMTWEPIGFSLQLG